MTDDSFVDVVADDGTAVDLTKEVDFSFPEGLREAAASLDFLPEDAREQMVIAATFDMLSLIG